MAGAFWIAIETGGVGAATGGCWLVTDGAVTLGAVNGVACGDGVGCGDAFDCGEGAFWGEAAGDAGVSGGPDSLDGGDGSDCGEAFGCAGVVFGVEGF